MKHLEIIVTGRVQGVFFRASTLDKARELGIRGYVMNQHDGSVLIHAEADSDSMNEFVDWCSVGPAHANVKEIKTREIEPGNFTAFRIKRF